MALLLDSTLNGETANSYCDVAFADDYFDNHFNSLKTTTWSALGDSQKQQALISATQSLEMLRFTVPTDASTQSELTWDNVQNRFTNYTTLSEAPAKYSIYQALQFPRNVDIKSNGTIYIPERVMIAECEQAIFLVNLDESALSNALQGVFLDRVGLGRGQIELTQEYKTLGVALSPLAYDWVKPYLLKSVRIRRA